MEDSKIDALLIKPGEFPERVNISTDLEALQKSVGGLIEVTYPFADEVGLICNEEGKIRGMPLNRAIFSDGGSLNDIIAGPFIIAGLTEESFGSLSEDQMQHYGELFHTPEKFLRLNNRIMVIPISYKEVETTKRRNAAKSKKAQDIGDR